VLWIASGGSLFFFKLTTNCLLLELVWNIFMLGREVPLQIFCHAARQSDLQLMCDMFILITAFAN